LILGCGFPIPFSNPPIGNLKETYREMSSLPTTTRTSAARRFSPGAAATLACVYEATAPKPGNVHPGAAFDDVDYADFITSAVVIGPILDRARDAGVGRTVLEAVRATHAAVGTNTNLGTVLLLAPLAAVPADSTLADGIGDVLQSLTTNDTRFVYEAIRLAEPGGLERVAEADVLSNPPADLHLVQAMQLAAQRDRVAHQYVHQFADVVRTVAPSLAEGLASGWSLSQAIVCTHVEQIAEHGDSLIGRKCGPKAAAEAAARARAVLDAGSPDDVAHLQALAGFDAWLRADGHRRNPGTTADLIAAGLFVLLREGRLNWTSW
jgi:triphosphoribosyl-dephospho-CoA synthase